MNLWLKIINILKCIIGIFVKHTNSKIAKYKKEWSVGVGKFCHLILSITNGLFIYADILDLLDWSTI